MSDRRPHGSPRVRPLVRLSDLIGCGAPDRPAVTVKNDTLTYGELALRVARVAAGLYRLGVRRGDRVVVYLDKRVETVVAMLAASAAGAVFVPVNPVFKARQVAYVVNDCAARVMVTTPERYDAVRGSLTEAASLEHVVLVGDARAPEVVTPGPVADRWQVGAWEQVAAAEPVPVPGAGAVIDADVAAILYTSGSTGGPKGVVLSHRNLLVGAESVASYLGHTADDVVLGVLPLSFDAGFSQLTTTLIVGAHLVLVNYLLPREVVRLCARHRVTAMTCVPPLWIQLVGQRWPREATEHLRYFANTGGRMPRPTLARLRELFPQAAPYLMYGLTEAFRSTYLDPAEVDRRPDSIGKAIPNAEILVVRPDGTECVPGEPGELVHRGALVSLGYWNDPERTAARFRPAPGATAQLGRTDGSARAEIAVWSGDLAYRDEEGFLYFVGRNDEMIKTSGYRISPTEIEEAAYATGLVDEVVALGVPDDRLGQHIVLVIAAEDAGPSTVDLLLKALEQDLPAYMRPQRVEVLPRLPRSGNGKFDRVELRRTVTQAGRVEVAATVAS